MGILTVLYRKARICLDRGQDLTIRFRSGQIVFYPIFIYSKKMKKFNIASVGSKEILIQQSFNYSPQRIFNTLTSPELVQQWFKPPLNWVMAICDIDLNVGGEYKYLWFNPSFREGYSRTRFYDGPTEVSILGIFKEILQGKKLVFTENYGERWYPGECLNTINLTETNDGCELMQTLKFDSQEARDIVINSGLEEAMEGRFLRIADVVSKT